MRAIFFIIWALIFTHFNASAICRTDTVYTYKYIPGTSVKELTERIIYEYNNNNELVEFLSQKWDATTNDFENAFKSSYTLNGNNYILLSQTWDTLSEVWVNYNRQLATADTVNRTQENVFQSWINNNWLNSYKYNYVFNSNNDPIEYINSNWINGNWVFSSKTNYVYNNNNKLIETLYRSWNGTAWINGSKETYTYDINLLKTLLTESWDNINNVWQFNVKDTFIYNANNNVVLKFTEFWSLINNVWENNSKYEYQYDNNNREVLYIAYNWDINGWVNNDKIARVYDVQGNLIEYSSQVWDNINSEWKPNYKEVSEYLPDNTLSANEYFSGWNEIGNYFNQRSRSEYKCTQIITSVESNQKNDEAIIYPNPVVSGNNLIVESQMELPYLLTDIAGKTIATGQFKLGDNIVNTQNLQQGIYLLKMNGSTQRIIVQ